jgi:hypothetical protein
MRLFAAGRRHRGASDIVIETAGGRFHATHYTRVQHARHQRALADEARHAYGQRRDVDEHGELDVCEQGRV